jgi:uncharacterized transporter YbjL
MLAFILARLREPSTWAGIAAFLAAAGVAVRPDLWEALTTAGIAMAGVGLAVSKDSRGP